MLSINMQDIRAEVNNNSNNNFKITLYIHKKEVGVSEKRERAKEGGERGREEAEREGGREQRQVLDVCEFWPLTWSNLTVNNKKAK